MKLSAEQFAELLSSFQPESNGKFDRRRATRVELQAKIQIAPIVGGRRLDPFPVTICDFSARGASFLHDAQITPAQQFVVDLPRRSGGSVSLLCSVVRSVAVTAKMYRVGVEFVCALQPQPPVHNPADDTREQKRIRESMMR